MRTVIDGIGDEGWDLVVRFGDDARPEASHVAGTREAVRSQRDSPVAFEFVLQISQFPWGEDPTGWLSAVAAAAESAGFGGVALMDHLIQIPQVGRAWDPIPEPLVTLGLLAGRTDSPAPRHPRVAGDVPSRRRARQGDRNARRAERRASVLRRWRRVVGP